MTKLIAEHIVGGVNGKDDVAVFLLGVGDIHHRSLVHIAAVHHEGAPRIGSVHIERRLVAVLFPLFVRQRHLVARAANQHPFAEFTVAGCLVGVRHVAIEGVDIRGDDIIGRAVLRLFSPHILDGLAEDIALVKVRDLEAARLANFEVDILTNLFLLALYRRLVAVIVIEINNFVAVFRMNQKRRIDFSDYIFCRNFRLVGKDFATTIAHP